MEDNQPFAEYLMSARTGKYTPQSDGGYLVPEYIECSLPGRRAAFMRFIGRLFRSDVLYSKGTESIEFSELVGETLDNIKSERDAHNGQ